MSITSISQAFLNHIIQTYNLTPEDSASIVISLNTDAQKQQFGDLSTNAALMLAKKLQKSPRDLAQELIKTFIHPEVIKIDIAGPGFINITCSLATFQKTLVELQAHGADYFRGDGSKNYSLEYVSANPTGPLHIGHGRGAIIGDVLGNILRFVGHTVTKEFYINDAGAQIQKLGNSFKIRCEQLCGKDTQLPEDAYHGDYLITLAQQCIDEHGTHVLDNTPEFFAQYAKEHLLARIQDTLKKYGVTFDVWFSEKSLHTSGAIEKALEILKSNDKTYTHDDALWFKTTEYGDDKDRVLRKNTGELTYIAADIAYLENKYARGFNQVIFVLGQDHHSYVMRLKAVAQALGHNPDTLDVILYQLVTLKESGELLRMSKRAGTMVTLDDVITTVGTDVARFFYLHRKADAHLDFDIDLALKHTDENPVYYIQYAYVRIKSILEKAQALEALQNITETDAEYITAHDVLLLKKMVALKELLHDISTNYQVHALTYYIIELAQQFHKYYNDNRVIDPENIPLSRTRLLLLQQLKSTFTLCLTLLGISIPEKM